MIDYIPTISQIQAVEEKAKKQTILTDDECYIYNRYVIGTSEEEAKEIAYKLYIDVIQVN